MCYLSLAVPERCPLGAIHHFVVAEQSIDMAGWILENRAWIEGLVSLWVNPLRKDQIAEHRLGVGGDRAFEDAFDRQGHLGGGGDGGRIGDGWGQRDGRGQGDGRRVRDGRGQGDGGSQGGGRSGGEEAVSDRFGIHTQEDGYEN